VISFFGSFGLVACTHYFLKSVKFLFVVPVDFSVANYSWFEINKIFIVPGLGLIARFVLFHVLCV